MRICVSYIEGKWFQQKRRSLRSGSSTSFPALREWFRLTRNPQIMFWGPPCLVSILLLQGGDVQNGNSPCQAVAGETKGMVKGSFCHLTLKNEAIQVLSVRESWYHIRLRPKNSSSRYGLVKWVGRIISNSRCHSKLDMESRPLWAFSVLPLWHRKHEVSQPSVQT